MKKTILTACLLASAAIGAAQEADSARRATLGEVQVSARRSAGVTRLGGAENGTNFGQEELFRAACCNLGESFVNNPSVDVNYSDAATGARQIRLLGLSGEYVQMLVEGMPMSLGAAMPYNLGYVPGSWMNSISVSKGASSVKNGFQSITGQINVQYEKPESEPGLVVNLYADHMQKVEGNVVGNLHLTPHLSSALFAHYEQDFGHHDEDGDLWHDQPAVRQINLGNRWKYTRGRYIFHGGVGLMADWREGGQLLKVANPYRVLVDSRRVDAYMKHAFLLDADHNTNIALIANFAHFELDGTFGHRLYNNTHNSLNTQLMLEHEWNEVHSISTGLSLQVDRLANRLKNGLLQADTVCDILPGLYAQYTFKPTYRLTAMAGLRADYYEPHGGIVTPRMHVKYMATDWLTLRGSTGLGYRLPYLLAEHHYLLASGREVVSTLADDYLEQAWNSGLAAALTIPIGERMLKFNAEYYYTDFSKQVVVDYEMNPTQIVLHPLEGHSFSHTFQVDANYAPLDELDLTAAFRLNDVRSTYNGQLLEKPLTSRFKALVSASWKPMMELWQVDFTFVLNGPGRLPDVPQLADKEFPTYPTLNLQVTRRFRHFSLYVGGENLTNYKQDIPVLDAANPWLVANSTTNPNFEPTLVWGSVRGAMVYAGVRLNFWKL